MTERGHRTQFTVAGWTVEPALDRLSRNGTAVTMEPRVMEVLVYLAQRGGEVVSIDELATEVWGGSIIGDRPVYQSIARLRKALGDDVHDPQYIATIKKRGYRLIAPVISGASARRADRAIGHPWSIAVLSFVDMSEDKSQECLGDSIAEELMHALANTPLARVVARSSSFSFKGQHVNVATLGEKLHVDTVLEGSVRKCGTRLRITAQLIKTADGYHIWSKVYDREADDLFAIQDEIATSIVQAWEQTNQHHAT